MPLDIKRFIQRFIEEAADHLPRLQEGVAALERGEQTPERINEIFRAAHTLKGSSRMLKLEPITAIAHSTEELLSALRDGSQTVSPHVISLLNQAIDALADHVNSLAKGAALAELPSEEQALCQALEAAATLAPPAIPATNTATLPPPAPGPEPTSTQAPASSGENSPSLSQLHLSDTVRIKLERLDDVIRLLGEVLSGHHHLHTLVEQAPLLDALLPQAQQAPFVAFSRELKDIVLAHDTLMNDLHDRALQMRMLPLSAVLDPLSLMVRDQASALGKQAHCRVIGSEIELDRQMIDRLSEPLVHLMRNALDHGLETPDARIQAGKPPRGQLTIEARQDGRWVVIEMRDDGAGINTDAIRQKAITKQLVNEEQLLAMSNQELLDLILLPGFSTKNIITDFSGRGVGMDVVKRTVVDELSGDLRVTSTQGQGTTLTLRLPLSLAMMRVLLINVGQITLGVTAPYVAELVERPATSFIDTAGQRTLIMRNEFVPVMALSELLGLPSTPQTASNLLLLVVQQQQQKLALIVDQVIDERDMIIKPLPPHLQHLPLVSGMISVGRNSLVSLLHIPALIERARRRTHNGQSGIQPSATKTYKVLVVDDSLNTREIEKDVLEAWGYQVVLAENGRDGLNKALSETFDAVLTDVEMPIMDGFALTASLRQNETYRHKPIIIITSREKEADRQRGIEVGADAYIVKGSFDQNSLIDTLKALLG